MMYFLARALMDNPYIRDIYIVDLRAEAIVSRLNGVSSKAGSHFRKLLKPIQKEWTRTTKTDLKLWTK
jgi:hypothetical protein